MAFWSVIHAPVPLASLGHLLEMKNLSPLLRPTELKSMRTYSQVTHTHIKVWEALVNAIGYLSSYMTINLQLEWLQTIQSVTQMCRQGRKLFPCIGFSSLHLSSSTFTVGSWLQQLVLSYPDMLLSLDLSGLSPVWSSFIPIQPPPLLSASHIFMLHSPSDFMSLSK